jgi:hypothetical protein
MTDTIERSPPPLETALVARIDAGRRSIELHKPLYARHVVDVLVTWRRHQDGSVARARVGLEARHVRQLIDALSAVLVSRGEEPLRAGGTPPASSARRRAPDEPRRPGEPPASWQSAQADPGRVP